ncbi:hypothetical protein SAMN05443247_06245 [Bradyrhizobium erythrophlei]|jgi:hypothetical protein|nr:hypothetical protein SAMN05443247_06245 [Bradyrhizobium erythrophlei]
MFPAGAETYDAVMKVFRHVYRTGIVQPLVVVPVGNLIRLASEAESRNVSGL